MPTDNRHRVRPASVATGIDQGEDRRDCVGERTSPLWQRLHASFIAGWEAGKQGATGGEGFEEGYVNRGR